MKSTRGYQKYCDKKKRPPMEVFNIKLVYWPHLKKTL